MSIPPVSFSSETGKSETGGMLIDERCVQNLDSPSGGFRRGSDLPFWEGEQGEQGEQFVCPSG
jgi:hypothetical protein